MRSQRLAPYCQPTYQVDPTADMASSSPAAVPTQVRCLARRDPEPTPPSARGRIVLCSTLGTEWAGWQVVGLRDSIAQRKLGPHLFTSPHDYDSPRLCGGDEHLLGAMGCASVPGSITRCGPDDRRLQGVDSLLSFLDLANAGQAAGRRLGILLAPAAAGLQLVPPVPNVLPNPARQYPRLCTPIPLADIPTTTKCSFFLMVSCS